MKILGITGSSGAGKSSICRIIQKSANVRIIDADQVVRDLQNNRTEYYYKIIENFGQDILDENKNIIRKKLAEIIFNDKNEKLKLDELTFKYVVDDIKDKIEKYKNEDLEYIIVDAPTLIEANMNDMFDYIIVVVATVENKINRICQRDNISVENAKKRLAIQKEDSFYKKYADFIIENDDELVELKVRNILERMKGEKV